MRCVWWRDRIKHSLSGTETEVDWTAHRDGSSLLHATDRQKTSIVDHQRLSQQPTKRRRGNRVKKVKAVYSASWETHLRATGRKPRVGFGAHVCYICRISPPRFLTECRKRRLNQGSFVLLFLGCLLCLICIEFLYVYFPVLLCLSVSVKWLAVKTASEMTYIVSGGALISTHSLTTGRNLVGSLETWSGPFPSLSSLPLSLFPPLLPFPSLSLPFPPFPFSSFLSQFPSLLIPFPSLIQIGVWGSAVSSPAGSRAEPRPLTHFVYFIKLGNDGWCQRCSVIVI